MSKRFIIISLLLIFISYIDVFYTFAEDAAPNKAVDTKEPQKNPTPQNTPLKSGNEKYKLDSVKKPAVIAQSSKDKAAIPFDKDADINRLKKGLKSDKVFERWKCAYESGRNADPVMVDDLILVLHDKDLKVRIEAVESLGKIGDKRAVDYLIPLLEDDKSGVRYEAIKSLVKIGMPSVKPLIIEIDRRRYKDKGVIVDALQTITGLKYDKAAQWTQWLNAHPEEKETESITAKPTIQKPVKPEGDELVTEDINEDLPVEKTTKRPMIVSNKKIPSKQVNNGSVSTNPVIAKAKKSPAEKTKIAKSIPDKSSIEKSASEKPLLNKPVTVKPVLFKNVPEKIVPEKSKKSDTKKSNSEKSFEELENEANHM
ncbi:MAG: HEAT repeat domain-containing protein [Nitrospirae bacterium]|nr:HEAT repeat domain-containing protein [Nitrospirota bacterium]